jgi:hypothetical protein
VVEHVAFAGALEVEVAVVGEVDDRGFVGGGPYSIRSASA